jgi:hypothetical protein
MRRETKNDEKNDKIGTMSIYKDMRKISNLCRQQARAHAIQNGMTAQAGPTPTALGECSRPSEEALSRYGRHTQQGGHT